MGPVFVDLPEPYFLKLCVCGCQVSSHYSHWPMACSKCDSPFACNALRARPNDPELQRVVAAAAVERELTR